MCFQWEVSQHKHTEWVQVWNWFRSLDCNNTRTTTWSRVEVTRISAHVRHNTKTSGRVLYVLSALPVTRGYITQWKSFIDLYIRTDRHLRTWNVHRFTLNKRKVFNISSVCLSSSNTKTKLEVKRANIKIHSSENRFLSKSFSLNMDSDLKSMKWLSANRQCVRNTERVYL